MSVKVGDTVLLPEFGATKVKLGEQEVLLLKDTDIIARLEAWMMEFCYYLSYYSLF